MLDDRASRPAARDLPLLGSPAMHHALDGKIRRGLVRCEMVHDVTAATDALPSVRWPYPAGDQVIANLDALRTAMEAMADAAEPVPLGSVLLKNPVVNPGKFICGVGNFDDVLKFRRTPAPPRPVVQDDQRRGWRSGWRSAALA